MFNIEKPIYHLLQNDPLIANFILGSTIVYNKKDLGTASAIVRRGSIYFFFNTEWMSKHSVTEQSEIIKHEVYHVLLDHCGARGYGNNVNTKAKNVAMDCAINQFLPNMPAGCVTLESLEKLCQKKLEPLQTWEYYYDQIKTAAEEQLKDLNDEDHKHMDGDGEGLPFEIDGMEDQMNRAAVRDLANKSAKAAAGKMSADLSKILGNLNQQAKINWKQRLRNIISKTRSISKKPTRLKANRRFELDQPGYNKEKKLILGVCTDSSGSVSDEDYASFMAEIQQIAKSTTMTYLVHADCEVKKVDKIKNGKPKKEQISERHGYGGTAYQPAIDKCMQLGCDAIIYFGDGDSADTPKNPGVPFIWVLVGESEPPGDFGITLRI